MAPIGLLVLSFTVLVWRGIGITLTAEGIHARRETGSAFIPRIALSRNNPPRPRRPTITTSTSPSPIPAW
ncbi:hypothetical protein ACWEOZ_08665 [Actinoplanes sp. NPDC004185]